MGIAKVPIDMKPAHQVKVDGFDLDQHEVTQEFTRKWLGKTLHDARTRRTRRTGHLDCRREILQCPLGSRELDAVLRSQTWDCDFRPMDTGCRPRRNGSILPGWDVQAFYFGDPEGPQVVRLV